MKNETRDDECGTRDGAAGIALIGGIHMDRVARGKLDIRPDTSTPGNIIARAGGVAANVARVLAGLDARVALAGRLGRDADGGRLRVELTALGIDISAVRASRLPTASYLALHHPDGRLAAAVVDAAITEDITASDFAPLAAALAAARWWFLDANLREETLQALCALAKNRRIAADAVSLAKAPRLASCLSAHPCAVRQPRRGGGTDRQAFKARFGTSIRREIGRSAGQIRLCAAGVETVIVTDGANGLTVCRGGHTSHLAALPARIHDVTGAGDALIGGTLSGLVGGCALEEALARGLAAAALTLEQGGAESVGLDAVNQRLTEFRNTHLAPQTVDPEINA